MITIFSDTDDISSSYDRSSIRTTSNLNNRRSTCSFKTNGQRIPEGTSVRVYDTMDIRLESDAGTDTLFVMDTYEFSEKYRVGGKIFVGIGTEDQRRYTIESIDHLEREIVLTQNLSAAVDRSTLCGKIIFGGVNTKPSDEEIGNDNFMVYSHSLQDWAVLFDLKNVAMTFNNQYPREIFGRMMRSSIALDSKLTLNDFGSAWTAAGTARAMATETDDVIDGTQAQKTGVTGAGSATWTTAIPSPAGYSHARFWWKVASGEGGKITSMKLRIGEDSSNYFEYAIPHVGAEWEDCWSYESVIVSEPDGITGTPELASCDWAQLVIVSTGSIPAGSIFLDQLQVTNGGFTMVNVERGDTKFEKLPASYIKPTALVEDVSKKTSRIWFIDCEKDLHYTSGTDDEAPFEINTTDPIWGDLEIERDLESLRNRVTVRGSETISETMYTQEKIADGVETSFALDYKPSDIHVYVANWNGSGYDSYVEKSVGIENLDDDTAFDFMMNFQEKFVRNATFPTLDALDKIKVTMFPYIPIRLQLIDYASVNAMKLITGGDGFYDGPLIQDERIQTFTEARRRAQAELDLYSNAIVTCTFQTNKEGLRAGQTIHIEDAARNINDDYIIQTCNAKPIGGVHDDVWSYEVTASSSLFGLIEFFQLLMRRSTKIPADSTEAVEVVISIQDAIALGDDIVHTIKSNEFNAGDLINYQLQFENLANITVSSTGNMGAGLRPSWYGSFDGGETGSFGVKSSRYTTGKELFLTAASGGSSKAVKLRSIRRRPVNAGEDYTLKAWIEILAALTNVGTGGGFRLRLLEYSSLYGATPVQTTTIFVSESSVRDFSLLEALHTMHGSATHVELEFALYQAAGTVSIGEVHLIESGTDGQTNPAVAGFAETSA